MCVYRHVRVYTLKGAKAFQLPPSPPGCPGTAGEEAGDITQLLNCYLQVSPSAGAVLIEGGNALKVHSYIHTRTYPSHRGVWGLSLWSWLPGLMGHNNGQWGSRRVSQIELGGGSGTPQDSRPGPVGRQPATPFHPWWITPVSSLFALFLSGTPGFTLEFITMYMQVLLLHVCSTELIVFVSLDCDYSCVTYISYPACAWQTEGHFYEARGYWQKMLSRWVI